MRARAHGCLCIGVPGSCPLPVPQSYFPCIAQCVLLGIHHTFLGGGREVRGDGGCRGGSVLGWIWARRQIRVGKYGRPNPVPTLRIWNPWIVTFAKGNLGGGQIKGVKTVWPCFCQFRGPGGTRVPTTILVADRWLGGCSFDQNPGDLVNGRSARVTRGN